MKSVTVRQASPSEIAAFGIPEGSETHVEILDQVTFPPKVGDSFTSTLFLVRTKSGAREKWFSGEIAKMSEEERTEEAILKLRASGTPFDFFDSGIVFLADVSNENATVSNARIVCRSHNYPQKVEMPEGVIDVYFESYENDVQLREWYEGTIVRVFTVMIHGEKKTFVSSRSKISCVNSRIVNFGGVQSPTIFEMYQEAISANDINEDDIHVVGRCFAFVLIHKWNQIRNTGEVDPQLMCFGTYSFENGEYKAIDDAVIEGTKPQHFLSPKEAAEIVKSGRVVMTHKPFDNVKYMSKQTAREYELCGSSNPVAVYFEMLSKSEVELEAYEEMLHGWQKEAVNKAKEELEDQLNAAVDWIYDEHIKMLTNKAYEAPFDYRSQIMRVIKAARGQRAEAAKQQREKDKRARIALERAGKKFYNRKFYWGGNKDTEREMMMYSIKFALNKLKETDGRKFHQTLRQCKKLKRKQEIKAYKGQSQAKFESIPITKVVKQGERKKKRKKKKVKSKYLSPSASLENKLWSEMIDYDF